MLAPVLIWRGFALPAALSLDEQAIHALKRRRRALLLSLLLLTVAAVVLWPLRRELNVQACR